jgi:hypothetical protein
VEVEASKPANSEESRRRLELCKYVYIYIFCLL